MDTVTHETSGLALDPFAFHGFPASCISGLGGAAPPPEPTYAFHSHYVAVARGHAHFTIRFTGLQARRGTLWLRVHMLPSEPGAVARLVTSHRMQLNWLAQHGGEARLRFEAFRGATYAVMGLVPDQTDASAFELSIELDRPGGVAEVAAQGEAPEAEATAFRSSTIKPGSMLLSLDAPSFAHPVSQPCTVEQLREPAFRDRIGRHVLDADEQADAWSSAFVLQVLDRYGLLRPGARGLALGEPGARVAQGIAAAGASCRTVALGTPGSDDPNSDSIDPAGLPGHLFAFDLLLSIRAADRMESEQSAQLFIESAMECLRPGGLAVHVLGYEPTRRAASRACFDRNGLERAALSLISRGHQVARIKPAPGDRLVRGPGDGVTPFGLIARRAVNLL